MADWPAEPIRFYASPGELCPAQAFHATVLRVYAATREDARVAMRVFAEVFSRRL